MLKDFKEFLLKQNALALAIGIIIGVAIGKVVSALVEDVINPVIGLLLPGGDWRAAKIVLAHGTDAAGQADGERHHLRAPDRVGGGLHHHRIRRLHDRQGVHAETGRKAPATKECPQCKEIIPIAATRCKACTQPVGASAA